MNRLWVQLSAAIGGIFVLLIGLPSVVLLWLSGKSWFVVPDEITRDGKVLDGPIQLFGNLDEPLWQEIPQDLLIIFLIASIIGILSGIIVSLILSAPISRLAKAAQSIGEGNLSTRVEISGSKELMELAQTFNSMAVDLESAETLRKSLLADVSHELRTPLTALESNLRAALDNVYDLDEKEIATLYEQTHHLIRLVNDLRELSLAEAGDLTFNKEDCLLEKLLQETVSALEPLAADKFINLSLHADDKQTRVEIDPHKMRQVFHNLIVNAIRYTPANGAVRVYMRSMKSTVHISVEDTGYGIEEEHLNRIFDRFYRPDASRSRQSGGSGLGLAIARAIIHSHGGQISVNSLGLNQGSTFIIQLTII